MTLTSLLRATRAPLLATVALGTLAAAPAWAADKVTFLTSWLAQAEHGGLYQAKATGLYEKEGLDVTIRMGGPQVNGMQLLLAKEADLYAGYDFQVLNGVSEGLPLVAIGAAFQHDLQGVVTHGNVKGLADLKGKTVMMSSASRTTWWPWLKAKYGLTDEQAKPYTFNAQPFILDQNAVQQAYPSSEPFGLNKEGIKNEFLLFANDGYPPYGSTIVTRKDVIATRPEVLKRFLRATMMGWKSYLENPAPGNELIKAANPQMPDDLLAYGVSQLKALKVVDGDDATTMGIGTITEARYKATYDYMVEVGLLKAGVDWKSAIDTQFIKDAKVMPK